MSQAEDFENTTNIVFTGNGVEVTSPLKELVESKLDKVERVGPNPMEIHVYFSIQKVEHTVNILYKYSHFQIRVHAASDDLYRSVDIAIRKLNAKLKKWKNKISDHHRTDGILHKMPIEVYASHQSMEDQVNDDIEEENFQKMMNEFSMPEVTKTKARSLRLLTTEEAIMRLELSGDAFLLYRCQEDQQLKVIYKRRDQSVGILQPEGSI